MRVLQRKHSIIAITTVVLVGGLTAVGLRLRSDDSNAPVVMRDEPALDVMETDSPTPSPTPTPESKPIPGPTSDPGPNTLDSSWGDRWIGEPSIDRDATMVAFTVAGDDESQDHSPEFFSDIYVRSRESHRTSRISVSRSGGDASGNSLYPVVAANGARVAFVSSASDLVHGDNNGVADVFVRDMVRHTTHRVSVSSAGDQANGASGWIERGYKLPSGPPAISADGRYIAFTSVASNLTPGDDNGGEDVFVHDLETGETTLVSATKAGSSGAGSSSHPSISADGNLVAFETRAEDLADGQREGDSLSDILLRDLRSGSTTLVSVSPQNVRFLGLNGNPALSPSGSHVAFIHVDALESDTPDIHSNGGDLYRRDLAREQTTKIVLCDHCRNAALSEDGSVAVYTDALAGMDQFCHFATREDSSREGTYLGACGSLLGISWDGRYIAFEASIDALDDAEQQEAKFGGPGGAMIYDRKSDRYTPAWLI